jgi:hypothetical protein
MDHLSLPRLRDRLLHAAEAWSRATGRTLGALSSVVSNHAQTIERLRDPDNKVTDATLERFAVFLADPVNWPGGEVPQEAVDLAHVTGVSGAAAHVSPGKVAGNSRL